MIQVKRLVAVVAVCLSGSLQASPVTFEFDLPNWTEYVNSETLARSAFGTSGLLDITLDNGGSNTKSYTFLNSQITQLKVTAVGGSYQNTWISGDLNTPYNLRYDPNASFVSTNASGIATLNLLQNPHASDFAAKNTNGTIIFGTPSYGFEISTSAPLLGVYLCCRQPKTDHLNA